MDYDLAGLKGPAALPLGLSCGGPPCALMNGAPRGVKNPEKVSNRAPRRNVWRNRLAWGQRKWFTFLKLTKVS